MNTHTAASVLALHLATWDMPTLNREHPEALAWIADRIHVDFDMASQVVVVDKATGVPTFHNTHDVRVAVAAWLRTVK
jgi:hypothetical protein